jgi:hypothetical protein
LRQKALGRKVRQGLRKARKEKPENLTD